MQVPLVRCRRAVRRTVLVVALVAVCFIVSAHGYSDVVNVGDVESAGSIASDISPPPTTTAPPPPTTPPPTPSPPPPTTTSPPPPTTTRPPPTTTPPPPTTTPPPTTPPPTTTAPPPPTTTPPDAGVPPQTPVPPSTTSPPTTAGPSTTPPTNATTAPTAKPSTTAPSMAPTSTPGGSGDGLTGGGSADAKSNSGGSSGKNTIIIAVVVIAVVVLLASLYVFRRHRSRKEDSATELQRQLDDHDLELGQSAYISTKAAATDDIIVSDLGASGGTGGNSGNGSRGSYSRPSFPYQKNQQSPASWSSERTTAVSAGDRESLSGLWNDPELLAARIPYEKLHFGELLSRGGFGEVYVGEYHNRRVAIKQLIPDNRKRMAALEDFLKEAALLVPLEHERIVAFVGVAWDSPRDLCIVLEFMPNGDLRNLLAEWRQEGRMMGWADVRKVRIALHVAEALTYLHTLSPKIVHRDLKSKNILLDEQWQAKLSDFGISRTESTHNTMTTNVGSSLWIAPEVMMGSNYNEKADIFSFGIVLTELDSLQLPYYNALTPDGRKMPDAAVLHLVTMGKLQAEFSSMSRKDMMLLGRACLAMDPMQRPTAGEIRFRLSQILGTY